MRTLAQRSIFAAFWNFGANGVAAGVLFVRSILLARLLPVDVFGVYGFAAAIASVSGVLLEFGLNGALLHRAPETQSEEDAAAVHFTLKIVLSSVWLALMTGLAALFFAGMNRTALIVLSVTLALGQLSHTPITILRRRVVHRRLALIQVVNAVSTTLVALILAWNGVGLWTLLATDLVGMVVALIVLYAWRPVWLPRLAWSRPTVRYFVGFGARNFLARLLTVGLVRTDNLWTGLFLGETALGYYSRAYRFATYPTTIIAMPVYNVVGGTYAELKDDRLRLSRAFFRTNALLIRIGFLIAGMLALAAPEFIALVLGDKWLPMLAAFRLMLVFTMLDPIRETVAGLFVAVGRPEQLAWTRGLQLVVLVAGLFSLGRLWGIVGVAVAVNAMTVVGIAALLWQARRYVDVNLRRLFTVPAIGLLLGLAAGLAATYAPGPALFGWRADLYSGALKVIVFSAAYALAFLLWERAATVKMAGWLRTKMRTRVAGGQ